MASASWVNGWLAGDIVSVTEFKKGIGCIADTTLGASAANINFTGMPTIYAHLRVVLYSRGDVASATTPLLARFNNDSGSNYSHEILSGSATTVTASESIGGTSMRWGRTPGNTAPANSFGTAVIDIAQYGGATNHKTFTGMCSSREGTTSGFLTLECYAGAWFGTPQVINQITLFPASGNFVSGTRATVYALGA